MLIDQLNSHLKDMLNGVMSWLINSMEPLESHVSELGKTYFGSCRTAVYKKQ